MSEERRGGIGEGIRTGIGILAAVKDAITETFDEAVSRGDLSPERAKSVLQDAAQRVQLSLEDARERLDLVSRKEFEFLRLEVADLRSRIESFERSGAGAAKEGEAGGSIPVD